MEGRKTIGGKLEVKLRIRDPLKGKQVDEVKEKWLVIDKFLRTLDPKVSSVNCLLKLIFKTNITWNTYPNMVNSLKALSATSLKFKVHVYMHLEDS